MSGSAGRPNRPWNLPGMSRDNAPYRPVEPGLIARITGGMRSWMGMANTLKGGPEMPFFPPGRPLDPVAPGAVGRRFDYPTSYNVITRPRGYEPVDFETLRAVADPAVGGYDLIRLAIETRKDQFAKLVFSILPRKKPNQSNRPKSDERCQKMEELLRRPDGFTPWQQWVSQLLEEHLVIDAPAIYRRKSLAGETIRLELIDGAGIRPLLNYDGRRPEDGPAYQQVLKGLPAVDYTMDELLYAPRNPRVSKNYGMSPVEQCLVTINIGLRRQAGQLAFFTDGNVPDAISQVPEGWTTAQIGEFQDYWDSMVNDARTRRKMRFVPAGAAIQRTRADDALVDQFDEWIARIIAYCFSLPPTPFVRIMNRATAENAYQVALDEGLQPLMIWLKGIIDYIMTNWLDEPDLELVWDEVRKADPAEKEQRDLVKTQNGIIGIDDMRADLGLEPLGVKPFIRGIGPLGFMSIDSINKAIANGWDLTGMPQAPMGGDMAAIPGADVGGDDPFAGLPPEIMQALGMDPTAPPGAGAQAALPAPGGQAGPTIGAGNQASNVVPIHQHPGVQAALAHGDRTAHHLAARMAGAR
jgi:hypothetical protein